MECFFWPSPYRPTRKLSRALLSQGPSHRHSKLEDLRVLCQEAGRMTTYIYFITPHPHAKLSTRQWGHNDDCSRPSLSMWNLQLGQLIEGQLNLGKLARAQTDKSSRASMPVRIYLPTWIASRSKRGAGRRCWVWDGDGNQRSWCCTSRHLNHFNLRSLTWCKVGIFFRVLDGGARRVHPNKEDFLSNPGVLSRQYSSGRIIHTVSHMA